MRNTVNFFKVVPFGPNQQSYSNGPYLSFLATFIAAASEKVVLQ